jgi:hypothetical protein
MMLRESYGPASDLLTTMGRACDYFRMLLRETDFPHTREFEEFNRDLARVVTHLETVVHDSRIPEQGRPCPTCSTEDQPGPRLRKRHAEHDRSGASDTWHCPWEPAHWWSDQDYRDRVATDYLEHARLLPAAELADRLEVSLSTVRKWTARTWDYDAGTWREPRLVSRRRGPDGRKVYAVADAELLVRTSVRHAVEVGSA